MISSDTLFAKYPELLEECTGIECGIGWSNILNSLFSELSKNKEVRIVQVKEKFGGLRIYYYPIQDCSDSLIHVAENLASTTCEQCGNVGRIKGGT
jgi:hypothetical protein